MHEETELPCSGSFPKGPHQLELGQGTSVSSSGLRAVVVGVFVDFQQQSLALASLCHVSVSYCYCNTLPLTQYLQPTQLHHPAVLGSEAQNRSPWAKFQVLTVLHSLWRFQGEWSLPWPSQLLQTVCIPEHMTLFSISKACSLAFSNLSLLALLHFPYYPISLFPCKNVCDYSGFPQATQDYHPMWKSSLQSQL